MSSYWLKVLRRIDEYHWELPVDYKEGMRVSGLVFADDQMLAQIVQGDSLSRRVARMRPIGVIKG